ncbi:hypothetical protein GOV08_04020 [Candidatus Woesearchaeota archaeon]|nr:hypothetical protein [Candidatus Woesearchaeota archaeon]
MEIIKKLPTNFIKKQPIALNMLRVIFDTNIYGLLLKEKDVEKLIEKINKEKEFIVYGYKPIRKEIQKIPKVTKLSKRTRVHLLSYIRPNNW